MTTQRVSLAVLVLLSSAPVRADAVQDRLLAAARGAGPESFAFTRSVRVEQTGDPVHTRVDRYDPSKPVAERWTLVSVDGHAPSADDIAGERKMGANAPVPGYYRLARWIGARAVAEFGGRAYRYTSLPKGILVINGHDLSADTTAVATLSAGPSPFVEHTRFVSTTGFRLMLVAKVDRVEATQAYRLLPDGRPVPSESVIALSGSMMGKAGSARTTTTYSDWRVGK